MTMHILHPDTHEYGLADDCPRCAEHAADPVNGLDSDNLYRIIHDAVDRNRDPLTHLDAVAAANVLNILERTGHIYRTAPLLVTKFFSRYGVEVDA